MSGIRIYYKNRLYFYLSLKSKVLKIDSGICYVDDVISSIKSSTKTQEDKIETLENLKQDINDFIYDVVRIDGDAAEEIGRAHV